MLKKFFMLSVALVLSMSFLSIPGKAQENPYAIETKVIKNEQAIQNLRQQQANLYLKMESLLVKYGELKGKMEDMAHRLDAIEARLNSLASKSGTMQNFNSIGTTTQPNPYAAPKNGNNMANSAKKQTLNNSIAQNTATTQQTTANTNETNSTVASGKTSNQLPKVSEKKKPVVSNDQIAYLAAKKLYDAKHYRAAIKAFSSFKIQYKKSKYLPEAIFYLAQSHFNVGEYDKAIISYDYLINTYPKNKNVPIALLREGISFIKLGDNIDGKYLLKKTINSYPNTKEALEAKKYLSKIK